MIIYKYEDLNISILYFFKLIKNINKNQDNINFNNDKSNIFSLCFTFIRNVK